jgi:hypothetical protein
MTLLLLLPAITMFVFAWSLYRAHPVARSFTVAVVFGIVYWYVMPGTIFLLNPEIQGEDSYLLISRNITLHSIWLINFSLALLLLLPGAALNMSRLRYHSLQREMLSFSAGHLDKLLLITVVSSATLLMMRFVELGPALALQLIVGLTSARDFMSFENISGGVAQSLLGLWELLTVFTSIVCATAYMWLRRTMSIRFVLACLSTVMVFASNGTRSVLLLLLFSLITALISRPPLQRPLVGHANRPLRRRSLLPLLLIIGLCVVASINIQARFANDPSQADYILLNSVGGHNDMFRELVYSITHVDKYRIDGWLLLQTPVTFAMPSFLGFSKTIPPHLVDFNLDRAGIDLIAGAGNVFPGLIADMYLNFRDFGPLVQAALSWVFLIVLWQATLKVNKSAIGGALFVTLLAYYVISFRNLQGSLGILLIVAYLLSRLMSVRAPNRESLVRS